LIPDGVAAFETTDDLVEHSLLREEMRDLDNVLSIRRLHDFTRGRRCRERSG